MGVAVVAGRDFREADESVPRQGDVGASLARRLFGAESPVGRRGRRAAVSRSSASPPMWLRELAGRTRRHGGLHVIPCDRVCRRVGLRAEDQRKSGSRSSTRFGSRCARLHAIAPVQRVEPRREVRRQHRDRTDAGENRRIPGKRRAVAGRGRGLWNARVPAARRRARWACGWRSAPNERTSSGLAVRCARARKRRYSIGLPSPWPRQARRGMLFGVTSTDPATFAPSLWCCCSRPRWRRRTRSPRGSHGPDGGIPRRVVRRIADCRLQIADEITQIWMIDS